LVNLVHQESSWQEPKYLRIARLAATEIALQVGKVLGRYKMGKHFEHTRGCFFRRSTCLPMRLSFFSVAANNSSCLRRRCSAISRL